MLVDSHPVLAKPILQPPNLVVGLSVLMDVVAGQGKPCTWKMRGFVGTNNIFFERGVVNVQIVERVDRDVNWI